jgi:hypothetical protein
MKFLYWLKSGPDLSLRLFLFMFMGLFILNTFLFAAVGYLVRENKHRVNQIIATQVKSCRDSNEVRAEVRRVIQDIKDLPSPLQETTIQIIERYNRLTSAQANLADKRCLK